MAERKIKIGVLSTISKTMDWFIVPSMRNLEKHGYEITLICNMEDDFAERNNDYAKCIHLPMSRGASIKNMFSSICALVRIFREEKFDLLYYMSPNASMYAAVAGIIAGVRTRIYNQTGIRYVSLTGIKRWIFKTVEKLTCLFSTHVKAQSPKNMAFAIAEGLCKREKVSVVGIGGTIGVELDKCRSFDHERARQELREKYGIPGSAFVYGYVGRVNADKGINELVQAFGRISGQRGEMYLALVGMLDDTNPISEANMETAKNSSRIILTGNVPPSQVYAHMCMFDVLVHPTYREGFGKVLQEAMGVGIPIITTDVPGPSEVVENGISGILCRVRDPEDLAEKMLLLHDESALRERFAKEGMVRAEKYFDRSLMLENILQDMNKIACKGE